jgi:hypothetical protein
MGTFTRRAFLGSSALPLLAGALRPARAAAPASGAREMAADLVIVGGGFGGCAAALAACRAGLDVILTEETDWIGGQVTAQAVPPDEHPWIESFGCNRSYRRYRDLVRAFYREHYPLTAAARAEAHLNPGGGAVSALCHEPRVGLAVLEQMLAPFVSGRRLRLLTEHVPVSADVAGDRVRAVTVQDLREDRRVTLTAPLCVDATELGDLLPLTGTEYVVGAESRSDTGEESASEVARPEAEQAFTCCFAMDHVPGADHTIPRPAEYGFWRDYVPALRPPWPGRLLSWQMSHPITLAPRTLAFDPAGPVKEGLNLFDYRRIADPSRFVPGTYESGISLVNWPQNDYWLEPLSDRTREERARSVARAKQLSLSLLYWMQTEAPRPDGGAGWKGLRLREDVVGTADGLAKSPYVRESRRILAEFTVKEEHVSTEARLKRTGRPREEVTAEVFPDSVGVGAYRIDLHPTAGGDNYLDVSSLPFQVPLGALLPRRVENLLPACKNVGTTHVTNGCYRLHPVEWAIGEAAGALAAFCKEAGEPPRQVRRDPKRLAAFQDVLRRQGVELEWPRVRPL